MIVLINVGDERDAARRGGSARRPGIALELGTYLGYGAADRPGARRTRVCSVELRSQRQQPRPDGHAGVDDEVVCVVGTIGDGGRTLDANRARIRNWHTRFCVPRP